MPHIMHKRWPRQYGFEVSGHGPSYVTAVEKGSTADRAGLLAGDHILKVDEQDVRTLPSESVKLIGRQSVHQPPTINVVSHLHQVHLSRDTVKGFGLSIRDEHPLVIGKVEPASPASKAGLQEGDIIIGINGRPVQTIDEIGHLMDSNPKQLLLLFIPIGRNLQPITTPQRSELRGHKARQLYKQLNTVLEDDFEKKMAVIGILKEYAENRNVVLLCSSLLTVLKLPKHRKLLGHFRLFIPPRHRVQFDRIVKEYISQEKSIEHLTHNSPQTPNRVLKRVFRLPKSKKGYGFVLKGDNPVFIESVDAGETAERVGLRSEDIIISVNGVDVRKSSHQSVVESLRNSQGLVTMEILRKGDFDATPTESELSTISSSVSSSWMEDFRYTVDDQGRKFKTQIEFLLTAREQLELKGAVLEYKESRNIAQFYESLVRVLDTPSKQNLWVFLYKILPTIHKEYCTSRNNVPGKDNAMLNGPGQVFNNTSDKETQFTGSPRSKLMMGTRSLLQQHQQTLNTQMASMLTHRERSQLASMLTHRERSQLASMLTHRERSQLASMLTHRERSQLASMLTHRERSQLKMASMLTHRERSQLKKALRHYSENRKLHKLLEELESLLTSPEKQTLWIEILPNLEPDHQLIVKHKYSTVFSDVDKRGAVSARDGRRQKDVLSLPQDSYIGGPQTTVHHHKDEFTVIGEAADSLRRVKHKTTSSSTKDSETGTSSVSKHHYKKQLQQNNNRATYYLSEALKNNSPKQVKDTSINIVLDKPPQTDTVLVEELQKTRKALAETTDVLIHANNTSKQTGLTGELTLPGKGNNHRYVTFVPIGYPGLENQPYKAVEMDSPDLERIRKFGPSLLEQHSSGISASRSQDEPHQQLQNGYSSTSSNNDTYSSIKKTTPVAKSRVNFSEQLLNANKSSTVKSSSSVNGQALNVLEQLDAAMATEMMKSNSEGRQPSENSLPSSSQLPSPPKPPPPPPSVAPPLSQPTSKQMNVKRINWEKLNVDNIEETVWGQIGDTEYLDDVIQYLELEQQFSTAPVHIAPSISQKKEVDLILSPKKAYNLSILLGHLKMSVDEVKHAVYTMDEKILTEDLLKQLLTYAPSPQEKSCYSKLDVNSANLSLPDNFAFQMSQISWYEDRLKAMLYKTNFPEKYSEIKEGFSCIVNASKELKNSKKLAKILELILAMGNHLNQGNSRVGQASAFRISYLSQLDVTRTQDNKHTFLHVVSDAVKSKYPDCLHVGEELTSVVKAANISLKNLILDLEELKKSAEAVSTVLKEFPTADEGNDRFYQVMVTFNSEAKRKLEHLSNLQKVTEEEFKAIVHYFGEDTWKTQTTDLFSVFTEFISKFENAHRQNINSH